MRWVLTGIYTPKRTVIFLLRVAEMFRPVPRVCVSNTPTSNFDICWGHKCLQFAPWKSLVMRNFYQHKHLMHYTTQWYPTTIALEKFDQPYDSKQWVLKCPSLHRGRGVSLSLNHSIHCPNKWIVQRRIYPPRVGPFVSVTVRFYAAIYSSAFGIIRTYMDQQYALRLLSTSFRTNVAQNNQSRSDQDAVSCDGHYRAACGQVVKFLRAYTHTLVPSVRRSCFNVIGIDTIIDSTDRVFVLEVNQAPSLDCVGMRLDLCANRTAQMHDIVQGLLTNAPMRRWMRLV